MKNHEMHYMQIRYAEQRAARKAEARAVYLIIFGAIAGATLVLNFALY